jgi:predicted RNA-binding protein with RPS1 domain
MGGVIKVKLMEIDSQGRYNLSHAATLDGREDSKAKDKAKDPKANPKSEKVQGTSSVRKVNGD